MRISINVLTEKKRWGVKTLLEWCVGNYKKCNSRSGKRLWKRRIDFLANLQKQQTYTQEDKVLFNGIRKEYINESKRVVR